MLRKIIIFSLLSFGLFAVCASAQVRRPRGARIDRPTQNRYWNQNRNWNQTRLGGFNRLDFNNDGYVSFVEWRGNRRAFERLDFNNDGLISRFEWQFRKRR
ncbi:MAG: hypothetical protein IPK58_25775 [Acidobacteria bacterium]|nr:hypothetical protein [Acidobacteriota bacterium]